MPPNLLNLPHEVLHSILGKVDPTDLPRLSCCRTLHEFIKSDKLLPKALYLYHFDDPRRSKTTGKQEVDWERKLQEIVRVEKLLKSEDAELLKANFETIATTIVYLLNTAGQELESTSDCEYTVSRNIRLLQRHFPPTGLEAGQQQLLAGSSLYEEAATFLRRWPESGVSSCSFGNLEEQTLAVDEEIDNGASATPHDRFSQLSAKLHCLYGVPIQSVRSTTSPSRYNLRSDSSPVDGFARARTYDIRQHSRLSLWGPFKNDGSRSVDWEKVEAIMLDLDYNLHQLSSARDLRERHEMFCQSVIPDWSKPFDGATPYSYVAQKTTIPLDPALPLEASDPYNVTGTWNRIVCFLDYTEFFDFNFSNRGLHENVHKMSLETDEAIRLITMKIHVTKVAPTDELTGKDTAVVWFEGTSSSIRPSWDPNANSKIKGFVRLTPEGEVHWTTTSVFHGEERWRSEGIQVGGIQSGRGVLGFWFDKDYDEHGPVGPTAFWKVHDGIKKETEQDRMQELHALHIPLY